MSESNDKLHGAINYKLCTAMDMTKLGMVLDEMQRQGSLHPIEARTFKIQAAALLATMRQSNDRRWGKHASSPII